jgi:hypothetical protein
MVDEYYEPHKNPFDYYSSISDDEKRLALKMGLNESPVSAKVQVNKLYSEYVPPSSYVKSNDDINKHIQASINEKINRQLFESTIDNEIDKKVRQKLRKENFTASPPPPTPPSSSQQDDIMAIFEDKVIVFLFILLIIIVLQQSYIMKSVEEIKLSMGMQQPSLTSNQPIQSNQPNQPTI